MPERNLIIIHRGPEYAQDFTEIAQKIAAIDTTVAVYCADYRATQVMPENAWELPTLTVALTDGFKADIRRGTVLVNQSIHKPGQHRIFVQSGIPTPPAMRFVPGMKIDPIMFGEHVVIKPTSPAMASYGRGIQLFRRRKLETMMIEDFPADHLIHRDRNGYLVQRFVDTGPHLPLYRVVTLLGTPLYMWLGREKVPRPQRGESDTEIESYRITSNNGNFREIVLEVEDEILDLATRVGLAFPSIPLLGIDIIRDCRTGKLFVLECNPGGNVWHFSSRLGAGVRQRLGGLTLVGAKKAEVIGRRKLIDQIGAFDRSAEILVRKACDMAC
jgi:hypothetical protein